MLCLGLRCYFCLGLLLLVLDVLFCWLCLVGYWLELRCFVTCLGACFVALLLMLGFACFVLLVALDFWWLYY